MMPFRTVVRVDLNCDLGELETESGLAQDAGIIPLITSANVACGEHAGSSERMRAVARLCRNRDVAFGAHPGFADREHFGRRMMAISRMELFDLVWRQIRRAAEIAAEEGITLTHVKPHGALYNLAAEDDATAEILVTVMVEIDPGLLLYALSGSRLEVKARQSGLKVVSEAFADRNYHSNGRLVSRDQPDAVLAEPSLVARRAVDMVLGQRVTAVDGRMIPLKVDTLCVHGDSLHAVSMITAIRAELVREGIAIARL